MAGTNDGNPGIIQGGSSGSYTYSVTPGRGNYPATDVTFWSRALPIGWIMASRPGRRVPAPQRPGRIRSTA